MLSGDLVKGLEQVLRGDVQLLPALDVPKACLSIFLSSHAKDTHVERHLLRENVLPLLQEKANRYGIKVSFSDMRYGAEDAFFDDHSTWIVCAQEIRRCARESDGLFFLSLQSCKYGYMPIPKYIDKESLDARIRDHLNRGDEDCLRLSGLVKTWYQLDENAVPPHYVLQSLTNVDRKHSFLQSQQEIREYLKDIAFDPKNSEDLFINRSVIEWETKLALELDSKRCAWLHREFSGSISLEEDPMEKYSDTSGADSSKKLKLDLLKKCMQGSLAESSIARLGCVTLSDYLDPASNGYQDYVDHVKTAALGILGLELDKVIVRQKRWLEDGCGVGIPGPDLGEMLLHQRVVGEKVAKFEGREALVKEALSLIDSHPNTARTAGGATPRFYQSINLAVLGSSGSGRTGLMAKLFHELHRTRSDAVPVIIRFCGHSTLSSDGFTLVLSIIRQLRFLLRLQEQVRSDSYDAAVEQLHDFLRRFPVTLFIDGLDQLSDAFEARSRLTFLMVSQRLHEDTRIVVSTAPDIYDESRHVWVQCFRCATRLKEAHVPYLEIDNFEHAQVAVPHFIVQRLLQKRGRKLTDVQKQVIDRTISLPKSTALDLNLLARLASEWTSDLGEDSIHFGVDSENILNQLLDQLEVQFGKQLVRHAVGFITFARQGIEDKEMTDLLSLSEDVLREVYQKLQPEGAQRVHYPVWLKLRTALQGLIIKHDSGCWMWYHSKLQMISERRFFAVEKVYLHGLMGRYFADGLDKKQYEEQKISHQTLTLSHIQVWFPDAQINSRRCIESVHHLLHSHRLREAAAELCSLEYVCACAVIGEGFHLVESISKLYEEVSTKLSSRGSWGMDTDAVLKVYQYQRWLCQNMKDIAQDPRGYISLSIIRQPAASMMKAEIDAMLHQTSKGSVSSSSWSATSWVRGKPMGQLPQQSYGVLLEITGHVGHIHDVLWTLNPFRIISAGEDQRIKFWNARTGRLEYSLLMEAACRHISVSPNGRSIAIMCGNNTVKLCDAETGKLFRDLHVGSVKALSWHTDSSKLLCVENSDIVRYTRIFDVKTGKLHTTMLGESKTLAWNKKADRLATASTHDNCVKVWDSQEYVLLHSLEGHSKLINALSWHPDGTHIVSASDDCTAKVWNVSEGALLLNLKDVSAIFAVKWSPDGQRIATASRDAVLKLWDTFRGRLIKNIKDPSSLPFSSVDWSPDSSLVITGSEDGSLKTWVVASGEQSERYAGHELSVNCVAWAPKGTAFASAADDHIIKIWDKGSTQVLKSLRGHTGKVLSLSWCASGDKLYSAGDDDFVRVWDVKSGSELQSIACHNANAVSIDSNQFYVAVSEYRPSTDSTKMFDANTGAMLSCTTGAANAIVWCPDGSVIAVGTANTSICLCYGESGIEFRCWKAHQKPITALAWCPNRSMLASASADMTTKLWDGDSSSLLFTLQDHDGGISHLCWCPDAERLATACDDCSIKIWNTAERAMTQRLTGHTKAISALHWCPLGSKVVSSSLDNSIKIWDVCTEETSLKGVEGHSDWVCHVDWNAEGTQLLSASRDKTMKLWDVESRSVLHSCLAHDDMVDFAEFDPSGRKVLSYSQDKTLKVWEGSSFVGPHVVETPHASCYVVAACWNPTGSMVAYCTTENSINIWEVASRSVVNSFLLDCAASSIKWSPDETKLVTGSDDKKIDVWDASSGVLLRSMEDVIAPVICVSWSPNSHKIAAGSRSRLLHMWDAQTGKLVHSLSGHFGWVSAVAWCVDGSKLVSGSWDTSLRVWKAETGELLKTLHGHSGPVFSVAWHPKTWRIASSSADSTIVVWETVQQDGKERR